MAEYNAEIYKKAFEIAVRCARELNGTPELKEAYQEAQKDNRALKPFMDFCLEKAAEEAPEYTAADIVPVVRCAFCKACVSVDGRNEELIWCNRHRMAVSPNEFCSYGERREGE